MKGHEGVCASVTYQDVDDAQIGVHLEGLISIIGASLGILHPSPYRHTGRFKLGRHQKQTRVK